MSDYTASRVEKPKYFRLTPLKSGRGKRVPYVVGFDTEADEGRPFLMQFSLPEHKDEDDTLLVVVPEQEHAALNLFVDFLERYCTRKDTEYLIYGWNIAYEYTQLFHDVDEAIRVQGEFTLYMESKDDPEKAAWEIRVMNDKRYFAVFTHLGTKRQIRLLDAMATFKTSLDNGAKMLGLGEKFKDDEIDREKFTRADLDNPKFLAYARRDAFITRRVGEFIVSMHEDYDVATTISAPHFASKVFRHHFLDGEIKLPEERLEQYGLWSYHGGKNGFYLTDPTHIPDCYQYDITSAYPEAMRQLPDPVKSEWHEVHDYKPGRHAIYRVTIAYDRCKYRGFLNVDGTWPDGGYIEDAYLTSYELDEMVRREECRIITIHGYEMVGPSGGSLVHYVDTFFKLKAESTGAMRETAKLFLNSLYGKFFQKIALGRVGALVITDLNRPEDWYWADTNPDLEFDWRAGGLYHPPIASLITGYVRGKIHGLEHKYQSLMTSTDGIFGLNPPDPNDLGKHLGGLTVAHGDLKLWRERLYIFAPDAACSCGGTRGHHDLSCPSHEKAAYHGFRGGFDALDAIPLARGTYAYTGRQMVTLKLSTRGLNGERYEPGRFVDLPFEIAI